MEPDEPDPTQQQWENEYEQWAKEQDELDRKRERNDENFGDC